MNIEFGKIMSEALMHPDSYNFHSHTQFCDGRSPMEEMVVSAIKSGMRWFGFSPHSPINVATPCNMTKEDVAPYLEEVYRLKGIYGEKISLYAGMEVDYISADWGPHTDYFQNLPLDFIIGSIHFIPTRTGEYIDVDGRPESFAIKLKKKFDNDLRYVVETFFRQTYEMIERGGLDILGHFDKIKRNAEFVSPGIGSESWFISLSDNIARKAIERGVAVEINTKAYADTGFFFPDPLHWKALQNAGILLLINSDAHFADKIQASRREAYEMLNAITSRQ